MIRYLPLLFVGLCLVGWQGPLAAQGDNGEQIATQGVPHRGISACMACHGADGSGTAGAGFPRIAGMPADYIVRQIWLYSQDLRQHPLMQPIAKGLSAEQTEAVARYYAAMPVPETAAASPEEEAVGRASVLAQWGDWQTRSLPACSQCHGRDGNGIGATFPGIAGQHADYLKAQLVAWQNGQRAGDPLNMMSSVAQKLTDAEIDVLAAWYASRPSAPAVGAMNASLRPADTSTSVASGVHAGELPHHGPIPEPRKAETADRFVPVPRSSYPVGPLGDAIRRGERIFEQTNTHEASSPYVGNSQTCGNCHLDAGRLADSAPMWAAYVAYPAHRAKNNKVNTYIERLQGCFKYSMNAQASPAGGPPAADSETIVSLVAYSYWLATGAPTGDQSMPGRGYPRLVGTDKDTDIDMGRAVYTERCAICHGDDGQGVIEPDGTTLFPPLWGAGAYNWGAGMHRVDTAAAFIKYNMPLGQGGTLSDQQARDVALFMNSHERPQDPRFTGDVAETAQRYHAAEDSPYGRPGIDGKLLGSQPSKR